MIRFLSLSRFQPRIRFCRNSPSSRPGDYHPIYCLHHFYCRVNLLVSSIALCAYSTRVCRAILVFLNFVLVTPLDMTRRQGRSPTSPCSGSIFPFMPWNSAWDWSVSSSRSSQTTRTFLERRQNERGTIYPTHCDQASFTPSLVSCRRKYPTTTFIVGFR